MEIWFRPIYIARPIDLHTSMNLALNGHLMSAQCVKKTATQDIYVLLKCSSLLCLGPAMSCHVIWLDYSNIQWGEGIIHLQQMAWNTNWIPLHTWQNTYGLFWTDNSHRGSKKPTRSFSPLCLVTGLTNTSGLKSPLTQVPQHQCCWSQSSKDFSYHQMAAASEAQDQAPPGQAGAKSRRKVYF